MEQFTRFCKQEWEIVTCIACALLTTLAVVVYIVSASEVSIPTGGAGGQLDYENIIVPGAFAFLQRDKLTWSIERSPFAVKEI
ncbi:MAG: hypothetical protein GX945_03540, partial [Lentisphaerae bacterium]|nr:hypothetical protein [Lentisphaerota bacterium]